MHAYSPVYIGIGSNLDQPERHVRLAIRELDALPDVFLQGVSSLYRSAPLGPQDQPDFINAVAHIETPLTAFQLLRALKLLEIRHGRQRDGRHWGSRTLDLDIILYGDQAISTEHLKIPHPGLPERAFVLHPLAELDSALEVPGLGPLAVLLQRCPDWDIERLDCDNRLK